MDIRELRKLVNFCKKSGIISIKTAEVELSFTQAALAPPQRRVKKIAEETSEKPPRDEDFLFWSSTPHGMEPS